MTLEAVEARNSPGQTAGNGLILQWVCDAGRRTGCYHPDEVSNLIRFADRATPVDRQADTRHEIVFRQE
jgi:hypothetical protein